jgi:hypothetical protein
MISCITWGSIWYIVEGFLVVGAVLGVIFFVMWRIDASDMKYQKAKEKQREEWRRTGEWPE